MTSRSLASTERRRPLRGRRGFTIVEVAVAATVMILAITSAIIVLQMGFKALDTARKTTLSAQIIQSEMERIRMLSWSRIQALKTASDDDPSINLDDIFPKNTEVERKVLAQMKKTFTPAPTRSITYLSDYGNDVVSITVTVTWTGLDGVTHSRSTSTRYSKNGLYNYYYTLAS